MLAGLPENAVFPVILMSSVVSLVKFSHATVVLLPVYAFIGKGGYCSAQLRKTR